MKVLIVSATAFEQQWLRATLEDENYLESEAFPQEITTEFLVTGPGMVNTAFGLGKQLNSSFDFFINLGIAGSYSKELVPGQVVEIESENYPELGAEDHDFWIKPAEMGFPFFLTDEEEEFFLPFKNPNAGKSGLPLVSGNTVNTVSGNIGTIQQIIMRYPAEVETMESAAFFQCCLMANLPFIAIRGISNFVEPRNRETWLLKEASLNAQKVVFNTLKTLF